MKKFFAALFTALTVALLAICLSACGGGTDYVGTYKFYSMSMSGGGLSMEYKVGETAMDGLEVTEDFIVLEVKEDSTFVMSGTMYGDSSQSGTWSGEGGKLSLTIGGGSMIADSETVTGTLKGDKLTISQKVEEYQSTIVLVKQKGNSNPDNGDNDNNGGNEDEEVSLPSTYKFYSMTYNKDGTP